MHPKLFQIGSFTVYSYGFCIMLGIVLAYLYISKTAKNELGVEKEVISEMILYVIIASIIGGKFFLYLADLPRYLANPKEMFENFGSGFVFYGSFLFAIPTLLWYFKSNKIPVLKMLDISAIGGTIVHGMGKIGCFLSGCCHGKVCNATFGVVFSHPDTSAEPINTPLYPVQLMDAAMLFGICSLLLFVKKRKLFDGQLLLLYAILYGLGRFFTEFLRGDSDRGTVFNGLLSHSQFIGLCMVAIGSYFYIKLKHSGTNI
jgi:phosphatidylglycerol---prolipoprotein diacylglyceryl transferase